jgi:hypothetical protein
VPGADQVDVDHPLPLLARHRPRRRHRRRRDPGIGDGDVEPAEAVDDRGDGGEHPALVGDVGAEPEGPRPDPLRRLARLLGTEVEHRYQRPAQMQLPRRLEADPPSRTGNERHLAIEVVSGHRQERTAKRRV